jgi:hypothetical protein
VETWQGEARLRWFAGGQQVGLEKFAFSVECSVLPEDDRLTDEDLRRLVSLQLICDDARRRYGASPRVIDVWTDEDRLMPSSVDLPMSRARWRLDSGGFCHGTSIMNVAAPPPEARLVNVSMA